MLARRPDITAVTYSNVVDSASVVRGFGTLDVPELPEAVTIPVFYTPNWSLMEDGSLPAPFVGISGDVPGGTLKGLLTVDNPRGPVLDAYDEDSGSAGGNNSFTGAAVSKMPLFNGDQPWTVRAGGAWGFQDQSQAADGLIGIFVSGSRTPNASNQIEVDANTFAIEAELTHSANEGSAGATGGLTAVVRWRKGATGVATTLATINPGTDANATLEARYDGTDIEVRFNGEVAGTISAPSFAADYTLGFYGHGGYITSGGSIVGEHAWYLGDVSITYTQDNPRSSWTQPSYRRALISARANGTVGYVADSETSGGLGGVGVDQGSAGSIVDNQDTSKSITNFGGLMFIPDTPSSANAGVIGQTSLNAPITADGVVTMNAGFSAPNITQYAMVLENPRGEAQYGMYAIESIATLDVQLKNYSGGAGTVRAKLVSPPKFFNPYNSNGVDTLIPEVYPLNTSLPRTSKGIAPFTTKYAATFMGRLFLADDYNWFASRVGDPFDWDYGADGADAGRAVAGAVGSANRPESGIIGLHAHTDDYLLIFTRGGTFVMRGDPVLGGGVQTLSNTVGPIGPGAWCSTPTGETVILARDGVYMIPPGGQGLGMVPISTEKLPVDLTDVTQSERRVHVMYDFREGGVVVVTSESYDSGNGIEGYFIDWETKGFWPINFGGTFGGQGVVASHSYEAIVPSASEDILAFGGTVGGARFTRDVTSEECRSYVVIGPIRTTSNADMQGVVRDFDAVLGADSGTVPVAIVPGETAEAVSAVTQQSAVNDSFKTTLAVQGVSGLNPRMMVRARGNCFSILLGDDSGTNQGMWSIERMHVTTESAGRVRFVT